MSEEVGKKSIIFNLTKRETHHPNNGFKKLFKKLKSNYKVSINKEEISKEKLSEADLFVFGGCREPFTKSEFDDLEAWLNGGGRALFLMGDGGEEKTDSNLNYLLEKKGISFNNDSVMRSVYYKYLHPKEVYIADGVLVPDLARKKNDINTGINKKNSSSAGNKSSQHSKNSKSSSSSAGEKLCFVYPYGATVNIQLPARPLLSSGPISYPMNRPVAGVWEQLIRDGGNSTNTDNNNNSNNNNNNNNSNNSNAVKRGKIVAVGSVDIFSDDWLDKEENGKLGELLFAWLLDEVKLEMNLDRLDSDLADAELGSTTVPNIEALAQAIKPCLQGIDDLPRDFTKLFDMAMFKFDVDLIPQVINTYETLGVPHEPLTLIPPQFECPLPKLTPAMFPPTMRECGAPALDQFDLDEHFAQEDIRLAQLTNKCSQGEEDLEYYIAESGEILNVIKDLPYGERSAKHILFHIFSRIVSFKKSDNGLMDMNNGMHNGNCMKGGVEVKGYPYDENQGGGYSIASPVNSNQQHDHELSGDSTHFAGVHATVTAIPVPVPVHMPRVDLVPLNSISNRSNLEALDSNYFIGGQSIGDEYKSRK